MRRVRSADQLLEFGGGQRAAEQIALNLVAAFIDHAAQLLLRLDAFGNRDDTEAAT